MGKVSAGVAQPRSRAAGASGAALGQQDFLPLALNGWGDGWNSYVHSMAWFEGRVYCGTLRAHFGLKRLAALAQGWPSWPVWPVRVSDDVFDDVDMRAQIWRFDPAAGQWQNVHRSPVVTGKHGKPMARDKSYRGMGVFQGSSDSKPALYASSHRDHRATGPCIIRSEDGVSFDTVGDLGATFEGAIALRFLVPHQDKLYTSPIGGGVAGFISTYAANPALYESADPASGQWRAVSEPGFGDANNRVVFNATSFNGHLYAGTLNHAEGFQLWKTPATGEPPYRWTRVLADGAYRGRLNQGVAALCVFDGALYVGTGIQHGGFDPVNRIGPAGAELIRVYPDDTWDLVMGSARLTLEGVKKPTSGFGPGFDSLFNGYIWRMCVHQGRLYACTMNNAVMMRFARMDVPGAAREILDGLGIEETMQREGGLDLWSTGDGNTWTASTLSGFGNPFNFGGRSLVSTPHGLAVGTVNSFGPEMAVKREHGWVYEHNPRGGAEVWLGDHDHGQAVRHAVPPGSTESDRQAASYRLPPLAADFAMPGQDEDPIPAESYDLGTAELERLIGAVAAEVPFSSTIARAREYFAFQEQGAERVPREGPVLLLGNNPLMPTLAGAGFIMTHTLLTLDAVRSLTGRPAHLLTPLRDYHSPRRLRLSRKTMERLGCVPFTVNNGTRLLGQGRMVLLYPERKPSTPPYRLQPFDPAFVRMSLQSGAPVVPVLFLGPHESHVVVEHEGDAVVLNKAPIMVDYVLTFLPPVDVREHVADADDESAMQAFCDHLHGLMRRELARRLTDRPKVRLARTLQQMYGAP